MALPGAQCCSRPASCATRDRKGEIIALWADGARAGDGDHIVGEDPAPGTLYLRKSPPADCTWTITEASGLSRETGGVTDVQKVLFWTKETCSLHRVAGSGRKRNEEHSNSFCGPDAPEIEAGTWILGQVVGARSLVREGCAGKVCGWPQRWSVGAGGLAFNHFSRRGAGRGRAK